MTIRQLLKQIEKPDLSAIVKDDVHLLLTAGDNIASIWQTCGKGQKERVKPYAALIDAYPELFRSTPFLPVLGNHDREIRPRGNKPPAEPVYDGDATAFRRFFELSGDEWKWHFEVPEFDVRRGPQLQPHLRLRHDVADLPCVRRKLRAVSLVQGRTSGGREE